MGADTVALVRFVPRIRMRDPGVRLVFSTKDAAFTTLVIAALALRVERRKTTMAGSFVIRFGRVMARYKAAWSPKFGANLAADERR